MDVAVCVEMWAIRKRGMEKDMMLVVEACTIRETLFACVTARLAGRLSKEVARCQNTDCSTLLLHVRWFTCQIGIQISQFVV